MRSLKIIEHISLDGVIQHSADGTDYPYGDWTVPYRTPAGLEAVMAAQGDSFDLLLGRHTYDIWCEYWPTAPSSPMAERINAATKYVVTHRPHTLSWGPHEGLGPDVAAEVGRVKAQDGRDIVVSGSSTLTSALLEHGLADEVVLIVYPVLLGTGKRLLAPGSPAQAFTAGDVTTTPTGVRLVSYVPAGPVGAG